MYLRWLGNMTPVFKGQRERELLLRRFVVGHLTAVDAACADPFIQSMLSEDSEYQVDPHLLDSFWHITLYQGSPKDCSFRRMILDARSEDKTCDGELKVKAS